MVKLQIREWQAKFAVVLFFLFLIYWIGIQVVFPQKSLAHDIFSDTYAVMALWGGVWGIIFSQKAGGFKSVIGRAMLFFSYGLLAQLFGQVIYSYYHYVLHVEAPYPSIGDIGFFGSIPFYIYGTYLLAKASGIHVSLASVKSKLQAVIIPLIILLCSYFLFLRSYEFDWSNPLVIFLDFGYPLGQAIYLSLAILTYLLSRNILGGVMRGVIIFILFALSVQYIADFTFLYQFSRGTWNPGEANDLMYLIAYLIMTLGLMQFKTVLDRLK